MKYRNEIDKTSVICLLSFNINIYVVDALCSAMHTIYTHRGVIETE